MVNHSKSDMWYENDALDGKSHALCIIAARPGRLQCGSGALTFGQRVQISLHCPERLPDVVQAPALRRTQQSFISYPKGPLPMRNKPAKGFYGRALLACPHARTCSRVQGLGCRQEAPPHTSANAVVDRQPASFQHRERIQGGSSTPRGKPWRRAVRAPGTQSRPGCSKTAAESPPLAPSAAAGR